MIRVRNDRRWLRTRQEKLEESLIKTGWWALLHQHEPSLRQTWRTQGEPNCALSMALAGMTETFADDVMPDKDQQRTGRRQHMNNAGPTAELFIAKIVNADRT